MIRALVFSALLALAGCASLETPLDDGYDWGDLDELRLQYCATADPQSRAVLLALMSRAGVVLPPNGACFDAD